VAEAIRSGASLEVLSAWIFPGTAGYVFTVDVAVPEAARRALDRALERVAAVAPDLEVHGEVPEDPPAVALQGASRRVDLLVVGSRGLGAFQGLLLGAVSHHVAQHAHCPVVVVRPPRDA
jgi:nucleotide-binding universal stress UspA family protein